ncbi:hypothetical protein ACR77J_08225 [Tissierella praeacuta]|uniref:hypothetical protein n=1 Tax=Tissierella praeacuta TaxID=43131 RepID=UPI003DA5024B
MNINIITQLIIVAFLVEAVWETLKMTWQDGRANKDRIGALMTGLIIAFTMNIDLFTAIGLEPNYSYVGIIASGLLMSRGGNYVHDLMKMLGKGDVKHE